METPDLLKVSKLTPGRRVAACDDRVRTRLDSTKNARPPRAGRVRRYGKLCVLQ